jgi:serine/threonine protein kinase
VVEISKYAFENLRTDGELNLYRGSGTGELPPILVLAPVARQPAPESIRRLEHEYSLLQALDLGCALKPLSLIRHEGRTMLILQDPGPEVFGLDRLLGQPMELGRFLRIAINLAAGLGELHRRGLIHKDIKPAHLLVDTTTDKVWLTGFGIASQLPRERQFLEPLEVIAGTLAYMAPEQTGRMNRSIDSRSDLYSLGITLYQMLTGSLPFVASEPIEWIHCHIARTPAAPRERITGIPEPVSAVVLMINPNICYLEPACIGFYTPSLDVYGSYFPAWLICLAVGVILTIVVSLLGVFNLGIVRMLGPLVPISLILIFSISTWFLFFVA